jgi:hypothetical protein
VPRLGDHERRPLADDPHRFAQDHLEPPRILAGRQLARLPRGLDLVQTNDPALGLRDDLLRDDDDVVVLERHRAGDEPREIVALPHLRQAGKRDDAQLRHSNPVSRRPATTLYVRFTCRITAVIPSRARAFASGPASIARPLTSG